MADPPIDAARLLELIDAAAAPLILDVRSRREFERGHVPGAINVPFWRVGRQILQLHVSVEDPIVVYCGHGPRARLAMSALRRHGFRRVACLAGHMSSWREAGLREEVEA